MKDFQLAAPYPEERTATNDSQAFTAADFSVALGVKPQRVRQLLRFQTCVRARVRGQLTSAWRLADLSVETRRELSKRASKRGYGSLVDALFHSAAQSWQPKQRVADATEMLARQRREVLAPILRRFCRISAVTELVRKAEESGRRCQHFSSLSTSQVRRLIQAAIGRDRGEEKWNRWELYLPLGCDCAAPPAHAQGRRSPSDELIAAVDLDDAILSAGKFPTAEELSAIWHTAFCAHAAGMTKRGIIERLQRVDCFAQSTYVTIKRDLNRKLSTWEGAGRTPEALSDRRKKNGRKPLAVLTPEQQAHVHSLVLATDPNDGTPTTVSMALRMFAQSDQCPDEVAAVINKQRSSKHTLTPTLKRQARITRESKMLYRGDKNFSLGAYSQPRKLSRIDAGGIERPILAGDIFEADDMTLNQPWFVEWESEPDGPDADPCAAKYGVRLLRGQLLVMIDVGSQRILGFLLLARPKDSYRAEDIWSWFGQVFTDVGLPRVGIRLERGVWDSKAIHGLPITDSTWDNKRRLGGLSALGVRAIPSFSPKTKSIESLFNQLQKVLGVLGVQVGRKRGEFERANSDYLACRAGKKHPKDCGFLHADEIAQRVVNACQFLNRDCREGEVYRGIPDDLWLRDVGGSAARPGDAKSLRRIEPAHSWIFMPEKRPLTIGASCPGMVRARFAEHDCSYYFTNPELFASLGRGYRVVVCFDPGNPEQGAVIFNNESGAKLAEGTQPGGLLGVAEFVDRVPQFSAFDGCDDEGGYDRRRRFSEQCRKAYRSIPLPGTRGSSATTVRDGRGRETRIETRGSSTHSRELPAPGNALRSLAKRNSTSDRGGELISKGRSAFNEAEELRRIEQLESVAIARGEILLQ